jgi:molybdopterin-guanine dinucleotide biosynthesis protein A
VSVRPDQSEQGVYSGLPQIVDSGGSDGPAAGLRAAVQRVPGVAWLVIAADMPLLDSATLTRLVAERDSSVLATAYRHRDGTPEPLCAIWEPMVAERLAGGGSEPRGTSLRRLLVEGPAKLLASADEGAFRSANTPADDAAIRRAIAQRAHPPYLLVRFELVAFRDPKPMKRLVVFLVLAARVCRGYPANTKSLGQPTGWF